jgi:hypothetical protein
MAIPGHLVPTVDRIVSAPVTAPPPPWRHIKTVPVGGLFAVGFEEESERLLIVSASGQALFDCLAGERISRNVEKDGYDPYRLIAYAVGPELGSPVRMSGLHGGGLPEYTMDGWSVEAIPLYWPQRILVLTPPGSRLWGNAAGKPPEFFKMQEDLATELRAFGFSWTGKTLIIAESDGVTVYSRG